MNFTRRDFLVGTAYRTIDARCQVAEASAVNRVPDCLGCLDFRSQCSSGGSSGGKQMHSALVFKFISLLQSF